MTDEYEEEYETTTPLSEFDCAVEALKAQIAEAIEGGESELACRKTNTLEKLLKVQKQSPETLNPMEAIRQRRAKRDKLMEELNWKLARLGGSGVN